MRTKFLKFIKYFSVASITFLFCFSVTHAEEHYKKIERKYVMDLIESTITYSSMCSVQCMNSNATDCFEEDLMERALICDNELRKTEDISEKSIERRAFVNRLVFTKSYELNSFIVGGEECTKPTTIGGKSTQGCSEFTITTKDAEGLIGQGTYDKYKYLLDHYGETAASFNNNIIMFNYDESLDVNEVQKYCESESNDDHPCSNGTFSYYQHAYGSVYEYRLNEYTEQTLYARGTNVIDKINSSSSEEGAYVCVGIPIEHHYSLTDKDGNYDVQRNYDSYFANYSGYYIIANIGNNEKEVLENCKKVFPQKIDRDNSNDYDLVSAYRGQYTLFNIAVYKITKVEEIAKEKLEVKQDSAGLTCSWQMKDEDEDTEYNVSTKLFLTLSGNYGAIGFSSGDNLGKLYPSVKLGINDIEALLNEESYFKNNFSKSVTAKEPVNVEAIVKTGIVVGTVAVIAVAAVLTFGIGAAITAATIGSFVGLVANSLITGFVLFVTADVVGGFIKEAQIFTNNVPTKVWIYYNEGETSNNNIDAICDYTDFAPNESIGGNLKVDCPTILDGDFGHILTYIMNILRFVGCALLILFGVMDFVKPIVSGDAEMLQKSGGKFIKRLIVFVLILFVPAIVKLLLSLIDRQSCDL